MTEEHDNAQVVTSADAQTLINALPEAEAITEDHAADMETQSEAIIKDHALTWKHSQKSLTRRRYSFLMKRIFIASVAVASVQGIIPAIPM